MIAFFLTPIGRYIAIAVIAIMALFGVYYKIGSDAVAELNASATADALERTNAAIRAGDAISRDPSRLRDHDTSQRD